jgi:simple sugar transport system permease protein
MSAQSIEHNAEKFLGNSFSFSSLLRRPESGAFLGLVAMFIFFTIFGGLSFLTIGSIGAWMNIAAGLGIIAIPIGLLMIAGELDISVGSMVPAGSMTTAIIAGHYHMPIWLAIAAVFALGILVGLINGNLVVRTAVPSFIVTLGTLFAMAGFILGLSVIITGTTSVALTAPPLAKAIFGDLYFGKQFQVIIAWWLLAAAVYIFFIHYSKYGNWIFAMGGDRVAARNAGVPTSRVTITLFVISATSAAFVGMCQAILFNSAQVSGGQSYIFNSIIAVVVGGVLLTGGFGSVIGILFGTVTFAIVTQGIYYTNFDRNWSSLIIGLLLLIAVLTNNTFRKMALTYSPKKKLS